jgi:hypothetical protein
MRAVVRQPPLQFRVLVVAGLALAPLAVAAQTSRPPAPAAAAPGPGPATAVMPGFETLPDGSTRVFVELSGPVSYEMKSGPTSTSYVLKETKIARRNNSNPLVTEYFNTPVTSARLVPHGRDLWLVTETRAAIAPVVSLDADADGGAGTTFAVHYPKGDYLPADTRETEPIEFAPSGASDTPPAATPAPSAAPTARPAPMGHGHGGGSGGGARSNHRSRSAPQ